MSKKALPPAVGQKYLITTDNWFRAPDGEQYKSVFGTVRGIMTDTDTLGIKTNTRSTNWYVQIGSMIVAGCQIHYAIQCDEVSDKPAKYTEVADGKAFVYETHATAIYHADL